MAGAKRIEEVAKKLLSYMIFNEKKKSSDCTKRISFVAVEIAKLRKKTYPFVRAEDIQKAEQILILQERGELSEESICKILNILNAKPFIKKLKDHKILV